MSCPHHTELIQAVQADDCDDAALLRYAEEVPACPTCRRDLAVQLTAHPAVVARGGRRDLAPVLGQRWLRALRADLRPRGRWPVAGLAAVAAAALIAVTVVQAPPERATAVRTSGEVLPTRVELVEAPAVVGPPPAAPAPDAAPPPPAPSPVAAPAPRPAPAADDWPAPPIQDLRAATARGLPAAATAPRLELEGPTSPAVGDRLDLVVTSPGAQALSVCVQGPEQGVVWRGWVPAGRTALLTDGRRQQFAFAAPGTYRFVLAKGLDGCASVAHGLERVVR